MKFTPKYLPNTWDWKQVPIDDLFLWTTYASVSPTLTQRWHRRGIKHILDVGCGAGRNCAFFAREGFDVTGLDIDKIPLQIAAKMMADYNLKITLTHGDMLNMPYHDNYFDAVYADNILSLTYYDGLKRTLSEIRRVLRPGGEALLEFVTTAAPFAQMAQKIDTHTYLGRAQYGFHNVCATLIDSAQIKRLLNGFKVVDTSGVAHGYVAGDDKIIVLAKKLRSNQR